jgi:hypothetical protein
MEQEVKTKSEYKEILLSVITETETLCKQFPQINMYRSILNQLQYIYKIIFVEKRMPTKKDAEPLTLGAIAIKNFEYEEDPYARKLINIYGNFDDYDELI